MAYMRFMREIETANYFICFKKTLEWFMDVHRVANASDASFYR